MGVIISMLRGVNLGPHNRVKMEPVSYTHLDVYKRQALVGGEAPPAFQAFAAAANGVSGAAFSGINHLVIDMRTKRTLHSVDSPRAADPFGATDCGRDTLVFPSRPASRAASSSRSTSCSSCSARRRSSPSDIPS